MFLYHPYWLPHDHEPKALPELDINGSQGFQIKSAVCIIWIVQIYSS